MKKITLLFLFALLGGVFMQGQELLTNGNFEQGELAWSGNALNVQTDGGNSFNFANVMTAGMPFDVNLSNVVEIIQGETYTLSFQAVTDAPDTRTMVVGIGLNEAPFAAATETVTLTPALQTFEVTLTASDFGIPNSRVLFDMGADVGVVVIDNVSLVLGGGVAPVLPITAAPTPPNRPVADVFSLFSDAYTAQPNVDFGAFGAGSQDITTIQIEGDNTQQINFNQPDTPFLLVDWGTTFDASDFTHFHMDYWIQTDLNVGLVVNPKWSNHLGDMGETSAFGLTNPVTTFGEWVSTDILISDFDAEDPTQQRDALRQFIITVAGAEAGNRTLFIDNLYLHKATLGAEDFSTVDVSVYPNPTAELWTVNASSNIITSVALFDMAGRRVSVATPNESTFEINASNLSPGIYLATIATAQGNNTIRLIKE
ncbi:T9SS type A sorting domain-containing protein [Patiriisocius sp. Uisw_017]|jgi:endoglucanase|uniref:T9SS type A sorting domain-containing protein n=1 Tax=Patiriisocius sp. Uisw_017 TaxID=3230968 RepID=UPI0039E8EE79